MSRYQKERLKYLVKEIAIIIILVAVAIVGVLMIRANDKNARESFGDGTCQDCGVAKYKAITVDRNGYTVYECPECYDQVRIDRY